MSRPVAAASAATSDEERTPSFVARHRYRIPSTAAVPPEWFEQRRTDLRSSSRPHAALAELARRRNNGFVRVSVTQQGGLLDVEQTVTIVDDVAQRVDRGEVTHERRLDRATANKLQELAGRCVPVMTESPSNGSAAGAYDAMTTSVTVDVGGGSRQVTIDSGEEVPAELGQLIDAVLRAPYDPPSGRPRS